MPANGNYVYVADGDSGLRVIDISNPAAPFETGFYDTPGEARGVFVSGDLIYLANRSSLMILQFTPTGIEEGNNLPSDFSLSQSYPNPFNAGITIQYSLPKQSLVTIDIFDILGRKIETIAEGIKSAGEHQATLDASDQTSGIYFYKIQTWDYSETKKMVLLR